VICPGCGALQPPRRDLDHFALLGLPRRHSLEGGDIEAAWRTRTRELHPDRFAGRDAAQRQLALQWSAALNEARRVLKAPRTRALYLATGRSELLERGGPPPDPDFLDTVFELQAQARVDPAGAAAEVARLSAEVEAQLDATLTAWEAGAGALDGVELLLSHLKFLDTARALTGA
jgi:molecular chaperone HscB